MRVSILARVRWRILEWLLPFLFLTILVNDIQPIRGAPQSSARFSSPQRQQNPSFGQAGPFQIIPDDDEFEDIVFSPARQRNFRNGASSSFGVPLSATRSGARQETLNAASAHFGAPLRSGARSGSQQTQPASFGVPLSASQPGPSQTLPTAVRAHFGVPLSATRPGLRQEGRKDVIQPFPGTSDRTSQAARTHFGVPLSNTRSGSQQQINNAAGNHFGVSRAQPGSSFSVRRDSVEDLIDDVSVERKSHFSIPTHRSQNNQRFLFDDEDDNISIERFDKSSEIISLGRRFHPEGIPRLSDPILTNLPSSARNPVISNPYIFTPDVASVDRDSIEDDDDFDDDTFLVLSPMVKAYNPSAYNERLSLSNDFLNQYNFVDVQGSTHWGYQTDSQYQDHKIHDSGAMEGKFGWTSPEGAEVNIKYIADEGGYRVLSSSGIYTREDEAVLRLKEQHLAEHEKARIHHQNVKAERNEAKTGVPLRNDFKGPQGSSISGSGGFVIVPDEDDFPLIPSKPQTGVPLPPLTDTNIRTEPEVGVFIDSSVGVPLPTHSQDQNTGFGVPLPDQAITRDQSSFKPHSFGVPLPDPSLTGTRDFGVPLPDPTLSVTSGNQAVGVPLPGAGASIPDSTFGINKDVGVSRSDPTLTGTQKVGVPLPGSTLPGAQSVGVPLPDPTFSRDQSVPDSTFSAGQGIGVPLPDPTFTESFRPETTFTDFQGVGVPLPDPTLSGASGTRVTQQDSTFSRGSDSNLGVPLPHPTFTGSIHSGVPLPDPTFSGAPRDQTKSSPLPSLTLSETPRESVVGVPLPDPTFSGTQKAEAPQPTFSGNQNRAPFPDPALTGFQSVGVPLPDPTFSGNQGVGVPLGGTTFSGTPAGESAGVFLPDASHRSSPHAGNPAGVFLPDHFLPGNQDFGVPLFDPILTNQQGIIPQSDPTISGNEAFGVPLSAVSGHQATGASIPERASVGGPGKTSVLSSDQNFGVPLSGGIDVKKAHKEPSVVSERVNEASEFDSVPDFKNGESLKSLTTNLDSSLSLTDKKGMPAGQELKVTFIDTKGSLDSSNLPEQKVGVPLSATIVKDSVNANQSFDPKDSANLKNEEGKTLEMDPFKIFGLVSLPTDSSVPSGTVTDTFSTKKTQGPTDFPLSVKKISETEADSIHSRVIPGTHFSIEKQESVGVPLFTETHLSSGANKQAVETPVNFDVTPNSGIPLFTQNEFSSDKSGSVVDSLTPFKASFDTIPVEETQGTFGVPLSIQNEVLSSKTKDPAEPSVVSSIHSDTALDNIPTEETQGTLGIPLSILPELSPKTRNPSTVAVDFSVPSVVSTDAFPVEETQEVFGVPLSSQNELTSSISETTVDSSVSSNVVPNSIPTDDTQEAFGVSLFMQKELSPDPTVPFKIVPDTTPAENTQRTFGLPLSVQTELPSSKFNKPSDEFSNTVPIENTQDFIGTPLFTQHDFSSKKSDASQMTIPSSVSSVVAPVSGIIDPTIDHSIYIMDTQGTSGVSLFTQNEEISAKTVPVVATDSSIPLKSVPKIIPTEKIKGSFGVPLSILTELPSSKTTVDSSSFSDVSLSEIPSEVGTPLSIQPEFSSKKNDISKATIDSSVPSVVVPDALPTEKTQGTFGVPLFHQNELTSSIIKTAVDHSISSDVAPTILDENTQGTSGVSLLTQNEVSPVITEPIVAIDSSIPPKSVTETIHTEEMQESFGVPLSIKTELPSSKATVDSSPFSNITPSGVPSEAGTPLSIRPEFSSKKSDISKATIESSVSSDVAPDALPTEETKGTFGVALSHQNELISNVIKQTVDHSVSSDAFPTILGEDTQGASGISLFTQNEVFPVITESVVATDSSIPLKSVTETIPTEKIQEPFDVPLSVLTELPSSKATSDSSPPFDAAPSEIPSEVGIPLSIEPEFSSKKSDISKTTIDSSVPSVVDPDALPNEKTQGKFGVPLSHQNELIFSIIEPTVDHSVSSDAFPTILTEDKQGASGVSLFTQNEESPVITESVVAIDSSIPLKSVPEIIHTEKKQESFGVPLSILTELPSPKTTVGSSSLSDVALSEIPSEVGTPLSIQPELSSKKNDISKATIDSSVPSVVAPDALPTENIQGTFGAPLSHQNQLIFSIIEPAVDHSVSSDVASTFLTEDTQGTSGVSLFSQNEVSPVMTEPVVAIDSFIPQTGVTEKIPTEEIQESFGVPLSKNTELPSSKINELPVAAVDSPALSDVASSRVAAEETQGIFEAPLTTVNEISSDTGSQSPKETIVDSSIPSDVATAIIPTKEELGMFDISRFILNERPSSKTIESATDSSAPSSVIPETFPTKDTQSFGVPLSIFSDISSAKTSELPFEALLPSGHNTEENSFGAPLFSGVPSLSESSSVVKSSTKIHSGSALDASSQTNFHSEAHEQTIPLEPVSLIPSTEESLSQPEKNFFLVSDNIIAGGPQDFGVGLNEGPSNTLPPFKKEFLPTGGSGFGSLPNVGVPLGPVTFSGVDLLQGPPVEQLDPSFTGDRFPKGLDPCLNSKLHPTLLPPHCANANVEPNQRIGKSLASSSSNKEQPQDSFIVVVNSDIFH